MTFMPALKNSLVGQRFSRLTVVEYVGVIRGKGHWRCRCDCGMETVSQSANLLSGTSKSCGCLRRERTREANRLAKKTHGMHGTTTYITWQRMKQRCHYAGATSYKCYGERGIKVCERWRESFQAFLDDMGERPEGTSIDRINNSKGYEPGNCRWARRVEQERNKGNNRRVLYCGKERALAEIAEMTGIKYALLYDRVVRDGWTLHDALSRPLAKR